MLRLEPVGRVGSKAGGRRVIRVEGRGRGLEMEEEEVGVRVPFLDAADGPMGEMDEEEEELEDDWKREPLSGRG